MANKLLRQSTAFTYRAGPFVDSADATAETGLSIAQADIQLSKDGGAFAQTSAASPTTTHDMDGYYQCPLTTTDTNTLGPLKINIAMAGCAPYWDEWMVVPANVYDALVDGADLLDINVAQISEDATAANNAESFFDGTGYAGTNNVIPTVTNVTNLHASAATAANQTTILNRLGAWTGSARNTILGAFQALFRSDADATVPSDVNANLGSGAGDADNTTDSLEAVVDGAATVADVETAVQGVIEDNHLDHLLAVTYDPASKPGAADALLNELVESDAGVARFTANALEQAPTGAGGDGSAFTSIPWDPAWDAEVQSEVADALDAAIPGSPTANSINERIQTMDNAYTAARAANLDNLDAAVTSRLATAGYTAPLDAAGTRTAVGLASANLDTQLGAINAKTTNLPTDPADASDVAAAIAALNNISASDVLTQVNAALNTAIAELGVGAPAATPTLRTAVMLLYMNLRNRTTTTETAQTIQNDAGTTIATAALSDDGTTMTKAEFA